MLEANRRYPFQAKLACREHASVSRDHPQVAIDEDRNVKAERFDAARDLSYLPRAVQTRIPRVEPQFGGGSIRDLDPFGALRACGSGWFLLRFHHVTPSIQTKEP